jgi:glycosyltransferase involved in cell wall biosynthesis
VALVHDFLLDLRGAERVFLQMCDIWPHADIFTAVYDQDGTEGRFAGRAVNTSFLQRLRPSARTFRALLPLYPMAIESFDFAGYDLVISSSSAWAHAIVCDEETVHVCYCHNPFRYAWNDRERTLAKSRDPLSRAALRALFHRWRQWDWIAAQRVDRYLANSRTTQGRVKAYFGRDADVIYPPVEVDRFKPGQAGDYYMVLSELVAHKRIDLAVRAFNRAERRLLVVGDGPDLHRLRRLAGPLVTFTGRVSDTRVAELLAGCRALVLPAMEEFGIAAVEAQAAGRPVIATRGGGALETVSDGLTGCFWSGGADELAGAVLGFDDRAVDPADCVANADRFSATVFRQELPRAVEAAIAETRNEPVTEQLDSHARRARRPRPRGLGLALGPAALPVATVEESRAEADEHAA